MSRVTEDYIENLVVEFPGLQPVLRDHLPDNFGELLPHLFFGDLTRYVVDKFLLAQSGSGDQRLGADRERSPDSFG